MQEVAMATDFSMPFEINMSKIFNISKNSESNGPCYS